MGLFPQKVKTQPVTYIDKLVIVVGGKKYHSHDHELQEIKSLLKKILTNQNKIMADSAQIKQQVIDLNAKADALQVSLDAEQATIKQLFDSNAQVVLDLKAENDRLQAIIDAGDTVTPEDLQSISEGIQTATDKIVTAQTDLEGTVD